MEAGSTQAISLCKGLTGEATESVAESYFITFYVFMLSPFKKCVSLLVINDEPETIHLSFLAMLVFFSSKLLMLLQIFCKCVYRFEFPRAIYRFTFISSIQCSRVDIMVKYDRCLKWYLGNSRQISEITLTPPVFEVWAQNRMDKLLFVELLMS